MAEPALVGVPDPETQLTLELGPAGIAKTRIVVAAFEISLDGAVQSGQRRRLVIDAVVDGVTYSRGKGELKWTLEVRSAEEAG